MTTLNNIRLRAVNERRKQLFGSSSLTVYATTPSAGETSAGVFTADWCGHRVWATTAAGVREATSSWQFQIDAESDWVTSQAFMLTIVSLTIGSRRWKVTKIEKPVGTSLIWKLKAQEQS